MSSITAQSLKLRLVALECASCASRAFDSMRDPERFVQYIFSNTMIIPMLTNCAPLLDVMFLFVWSNIYENLVKSGEKNATKSFNSIGDVLSPNNSKIWEYVNVIFSEELEITIPYRSFNLCFIFGLKWLNYNTYERLHLKIFNKRDDVERSFSMRQYNCFCCFRFIWFTINTLWFSLFPILDLCTMKQAAYTWIAESGIPQPEAYQGPWPP